MSVYTHLNLRALPFIWHKKQRLLAAGVVAFSLLGLTAVPELIHAGQPSVHQGIMENYQPQKISEHVWMIEGPRSYPNPDNQGFMNNPGFIVSDAGVAVIDPGSSAAIGRALIARIKKQTSQPVTHVFTTHVHGDHWLANQAIKDAFPDARFYGHPEMIRLAEEGAAADWVGRMDTLTEGATKGTEALIPTEALENGQVIKVGNMSIKAHLAQEKAHTTSDVMYEVLGDKVLFTGDNINHHRIVRMDDGSFSGSIAAAEYALGLDIEKVVPGHGPVGGKLVLKMNLDYFSTLYGAVKELREDDLEPYEMKPEVAKRLAGFSEWSGFESELGKHISLSGLEAEEEDF